MRSLKLAEEQKESQKYAQLFEQQNVKSALFKTSLSGSPDDYFPDYKIGNRTYLNTLANPNIAYFVELRRKFRFAFNPTPVLRPRLNQISAGQISVVWGMSVDQNGRLNGLTLIRPSGIPTYDQEAKRTIVSSAPFSRPPGHMLEKDGQMHMAWTFVVYL